MEQFYSLDSKFRFQLFFLDHLTALLLIVILNILIYLARDSITPKARYYIRLVLSVILISQELALQVWDISNGIWSIQGSLPLHLCGISLLLISLMLFTRSKWIYQVAYFWGVAGATQALITPDLTYGFPHFIFIQFFTAHGLIVTGCLWMTFVEGFRPSFSSLVKAFVFTNLYAMIIGVFNYLTNSNYLYLCRKPINSSLLDYVGEWPWYLISLELFALFFFFLSALPFLWSDIKVKSRRYLSM